MNIEDIKKKLRNATLEQKQTGGGKYYVYEHWRMDRNECFYVGKGFGNRAYIFKDRNRFHKAIVEKLSREGSAFEVRIVALNINEDEALRIERERIAFWRNDGADLANITSGGQGMSGYRHSDETRKKISEIVRANPPFKGKRHTPETIEFYIQKGKRHGPPKLTDESKKKIVAFHTGRRRSPETCARISESLKGKPSWAKGKPSKLKGRKLSQATKDKMSAAQKLKWVKQKASGWENPTKGSKMSDESRAKMKAAHARRRSVA